MAHDIEQMFSVRDVPWHKPQTGDRTTVLEDFPQNFAEARVLAGLDWDPVAYPVTADSVMTSAQFRERAEAILWEPLAAAQTTDKLVALWEESFRRTVTEPEFTSLAEVAAHIAAADAEAGKQPQWNRIARSDTGATLSYQRASYNIIPNSAFGEIIDAIIGTENGAVKLETGGCLGGGASVWMLARLDEPMQFSCKGRKDASLTFPYLGLTSDHTGKAALAARLTTIRIVCRNTLSLSEAEGERTGAVFSFSHRGDWHDRIEEAREALQFARNEVREYTDAMNDLLGIPISPEQETMWLREFIPSPPDSLISDRVMKNIEEGRAAVLGFLNSETVEGAGIRGTAYALVQAASEYTDYYRTARSFDSGLQRSLLKAAPLKAKAAVLAREAALA
jgi:phage/plasmid-like protein (TIGR03299 family)